MSKTRICLIALAFGLMAQTALGQSASTTISGIVTSVDGRAVSNALVTSHRGNASASVTTDATGAFTIAAITLPITLDIAAPGFATAHIVVRSSPVTILLTAAAIAESVVVTGERDPEWHDAATGATVLTHDDVDRIPSVTADEVLHVISGFSLYRRSSSRTANPTTNGVTMRGLSASGSSRALVLLDGVPLNDGFGGWVTWTRLPVGAIDQIEIDRGPAGDAFGTDALGGLIRIASPDGERTSAEMQTEVGSLDTRSLDVSGGRRAKGVALFGAVSVFDTAGSIPLEPASRGPVDQPTDARWFNGFGRMTIGPATRRWTFSADGGSDDRGNGTVLQRNHSRGGTFTTSFDSTLGQTTFAARVSVTPDDFYQTFTAVAANRATEKLTSTQTIDAVTTRGIAEVGHRIPHGEVQGRVSIADASADYSEVKPTTSTTKALTDDSVAVSANAGFAPINTLTLAVGARHEWRTAPMDSGPSQGATVGHASVAWRAASALTFRGDVATSHRWPTLNELVRDFQVGNVLTEANPALKPERARSVEAGAAYQRKRWQASATVFDSVIDDAIANVTLTTSATSIVRQRQNAGDAHARGVEMDAEVRATTRLRLRVSTTIADATFEQSIEPALEGDQLPQVPRVSAGLEADASLPRRMTASVVVHSVSSQFDDDRNQFELTPATQVDARVAGRVRHFGWQVTLENLFNARIEVGKTPLVTLAPGRAIRVGISWRR